VGVVATDIVDRVLERVHADGGFNDVEPVPFLDDTTTRNVIVDRGELSGIVDVDGLCYGDPLFVVALTRMALLSRDWPTDYADGWFDALRTMGSATKRRLDLYTAIFGVNFLSELGQQFNADSPPAVDPAQVRRLMGIVDSLVARLA
jgi:aminoglycoside phosphotransferase (APT) family kinase protein